MMMNTEATMRQVYQDAQAACGLKIGDFVEIERIPDDFECGWPGRVTPKAGGYLGLKGKIENINYLGLQVASEYFPYFVLKKIAKPAPVFKPCDRVLVRDWDDQRWHPHFFAFYREGSEDPYISIVGIGYKQCLPYEGNEHLCDTTDSPE